MSSMLGHMPRERRRRTGRRRSGDAAAPAIRRRELANAQGTGTSTLAGLGSRLASAARLPRCRLCCVLTWHTFLGITPITPSAHDSLDLRSRCVRIRDAGDLHHARGAACPLKQFVAPRNLRACVKQQARVQLASRVEAREVAAIGKRGRLPLDALVDSRIGAEYDSSKPQHHVVARIV